MRAGPRGRRVGDCGFAMGWRCRLGARPATQAGAVLILLTLIYSQPFFFGLEASIHSSSTGMGGGRAEQLRPNIKGLTSAVVPSLGPLHIMSFYRD